MNLKTDLKKCPRCPAVGTIVEMGLCCRVLDLELVDWTTDKYRALPWRPKYATRRANGSRPG